MAASLYSLNSLFNVRFDNDIPFVQNCTCEKQAHENNRTTKFAQEISITLPDMVRAQFELGRAAHHKKIGSQ